MPRSPYIVSSECPYHVTARSINRDWFHSPMEEVWGIMEDYLYFCTHAFNIKIHAFVLMVNHFHLLVSTPEGNLSEAMRYFMRETSRAIAKGGDRINQTYGSRFYRCLIDSNHYFLHAYKYVYRNPVKAMLVHNVEDYKFSTLYGLLGRGQATIPMVEDFLMFDSNIRDHLVWLNTTPIAEHDKDVGLALRRARFRLRSRNRRHQILHDLETEMF